MTTTLRLSGLLAVLLASFMSHVGAQVFLPPWKCGVTNGVPSFSARDGRAQLVGFDVDVCTKLGGYLGITVQVVGLDAGKELEALDSGEVLFLVTSRLSPTNNPPVSFPVLAAKYRVTRPYVRLLESSHNSHSWVVLRRDQEELANWLDKAVWYMGVSGDYGDLYKRWFLTTAPKIDP